MKLIWFSAHFRWRSRLLALTSRTRASEALLVIIRNQRRGNWIIKFHFLRFLADRYSSVLCAIVSSLPAHFPSQHSSRCFILFPNLYTFFGRENDQSTSTDNGCFPCSSPPLTKGGRRRRRIVRKLVRLEGNVVRFLKTRGASARPSQK